MAGLNMKQQMSFGKFVMVVLGCYFVYVIIMANLEWQSNQIGTIFRTVSEKTVQGPSLLLTFKKDDFEFPNSRKCKEKFTCLFHMHCF